MKANQYEVSKIQSEIDVRQPALDEAHVKLFISLIESGVYLPPVYLYLRNGSLFIQDGRHRVEAYRRIGKRTILGVEVPYTTRTEMQMAALKANMTAKGAPLQPTEDDFAMVIRNVGKDGISQPEAIRLLEKIGVPTAFAQRMVRRTFHSVRKLDEFHAVEAVKAKRLSIMEAGAKYNVAVTIIKRKLNHEHYGLASFVLDLDKKLKTVRTFVGQKLSDLAHSDGPNYAGEALSAAQKKVGEVSRWLSAQEPAFTK